MQDLLALGARSLRPALVLSHRAWHLDTLIDFTSWLQAGLDYVFTDARYVDGRTHFTQVNAQTGAIQNQTIILGPYGDAARNAGSIYLRVAHDLPNLLGQFVVRQDIYSQIYFYYSNLTASLNVAPDGIGPLDPKTRIGGYTLINAGIEWNHIDRSMFHASDFVRNMLNKQYEVGGLGGRPQHLSMAWNRGGQAQVKSRAAPGGTDRPQAPTMRLAD